MTTQAMVPCWTYAKTNVWGWHTECEEDNEGSVDIYCMICFCWHGNSYSWSRNSAKGGANPSHRICHCSRSDSNQPIWVHAQLQLLAKSLTWIWMARGCSIPTLILEWCTVLRYIIRRGSLQKRWQFTLQYSMKTHPIQSTKGTMNCNEYVFIGQP